MVSCKCCCSCSRSAKNRLVQVTCTHGTKKLWLTWSCSTVILNLPSSHIMICNRVFLFPRELTTQHATGRRVTNLSQYVTISRKKNLHPLNKEDMADLVMQHGNCNAHVIKSTYHGLLHNFPFSQGTDDSPATGPLVTNHFQSVSIPL